MSETLLDLGDHEILGLRIIDGLQSDQSKPSNIFTIMVSLRF